MKFQVGTGKGAGHHWVELFAKIKFGRKKVLTLARFVFRYVAYFCTLGGFLKYETCKITSVVYVYFFMCVLLMDVRSHFRYLFRSPPFIIDFLTLISQNVISLKGGLLWGCLSHFVDWQMRREKVDEIIYRIMLCILRFLEKRISCLRTLFLVLGSSWLGI